MREGSADISNIRIYNTTLSPSFVFQVHRCMASGSLFLDAQNWHLQAVSLHLKSRTSLCPLHSQVLFHPLCAVHTVRVCVCAGVRVRAFMGVLEPYSSAFDFRALLAAAVRITSVSHPPSRSQALVTATVQQQPKIKFSLLCR